MKEIPILFSTPMVQAILDGRKSQTRRIVKYPKAYKINELIEWEIKPHKDTPELYSFWYGTHYTLPAFKCPYGQPGDVLWVKETYTVLEPEHIISGKMKDRFAFKADMKTKESEETRKEYIAMGYPYKWKSSRFMPKEACRIRLLIENIWVKRLVRISDISCIAEGIEKMGIGFKDYSEEGASVDSPYYSYKTLWESINGEGSWEKNPYVWVIKFKTIKTN